MVEHARYGSKHAALRIDAQGPDAILHPATGAVVGHRRSLVAEFGVLGAEYVARDTDGEPLYRDENGDPYVSVDIRGHRWDSEVAQAENGWTDDETLSVLAQVEYFCRTQPDLVWKLAAPVAVLPWPTYDDTHHKSIPTLAAQIGKVTEALAYEQQNKNRVEVIARLEEVLRERSADAEAEQALTVG